MLEVPNHTPNKDSFRFERIENGLKVAGSYRLEYELRPVLPGKGPLTISTHLIVSPGPLARFDVRVRRPAARPLSILDGLQPTHQESGCFYAQSMLLTSSS